MTARRPVIFGWLTALICLVAGCSSGTPVADTSSPSTATTSSGPVPSPGDRDSIEGTFDVGGHKLYLSCVGTGSPTVIYVHGSITEAQVVPHDNAGAIQRTLSGDHRALASPHRAVIRSVTAAANSSWMHPGPRGIAASRPSNENASDPHRARTVGHSRNLEHAQRQIDDRYLTGLGEGLSEARSAHRGRDGRA
jgi:hypothetical protein